MGADCAIARLFWQGCWFNPKAIAGCILGAIIERRIDHQRPGRSGAAVPLGIDGGDEGRNRAHRHQLAGVAGGQLQASAGALAEGLEQGATDGAAFVLVEEDGVSDARLDAQREGGEG